MQLLILPMLVCACLAIECQKNVSAMGLNLYNVKQLKSDLDCYLSKGACEKLSAACKRRIPQDVSQACKKCNPRYKHHLKVFLARIRELFPEDYATFRRKYDPSGKNFPALEAKLYKY